MQHCVSFSFYKWDGPYLIMVTGPGRSTEGQQPLHHVWIAADHITPKMTSNLNTSGDAAACTVCMVSKRQCWHMAVFKGTNVQGTSM